MGDCFAPLGPPLLPWDSMAQTHKQTNRQTDKQTDMATPRPTRPSGAELVKIFQSRFFSTALRQLFSAMQVSIHLTGSKITNDC